MKFLIVLLLAAYCQAKITEDATPGEFPWQCSLQRHNGVYWRHNCGCSLLSATTVLTAAHCVVGTSPSNIRVVGGLHRRSDESNAVASIVANIRVHENYNDGQATFSNDIATLTLVDRIEANGGTIQYATLPSSNDQLTGQTCVISGWGGEGSIIYYLPDTLQKGDIKVILQTVCNALFEGVPEAAVSPAQICVYDYSQNVIACGGDAGGPLNCGTGASRFVAGVMSWAIININGNCMTNYPSVYTRTSHYIDWINAGL